LSGYSLVTQARDSSPWSTSPKHRVYFYTFIACWQEMAVWVRIKNWTWRIQNNYSLLQVIFQDQHGRTKVLANRNLPKTKKQYYALVSVVVMPRLRLSAAVSPLPHRPSFTYFHSVDPYKGK
jgi:hypothetical protein